MHDRYSSGPFSRVFFLYTRHGLRTYTYRINRLQSSRSLINTISSTYDGGPRFSEVFVDTEYLRSL